MEAIWTRFLPSTRKVLELANTDELGKIIQFVNETNLNLTVTSSTGKHRKGGIINQNKHILVNLSHWKNIDLVDRRNRVCRVEPGVTYPQLVTALALYGMTIPMPLAPRNGKSVLAAVMDREPSTWANKQWDSADPVGIGIAYGIFFSRMCQYKISI